MRCAFIATAVGIMTGLAAPTFARAPLDLGEQTPASYDAVRDARDRIDDHLAGAQCGGRVNDTVAGKTARVTGVPGRYGVWNGAILSGMASRADVNANGDPDDDYFFPSSAVGLATSCWEGTDRVTKGVWLPSNNPLRPNEVTQVDRVFPYPYFEDPVCDWRLRADGGFSGQAPSIPLLPIDEYDAPPTYGRMTDDAGRTNRQSPPNCIDFCRYVNTFVYRGCAEPQLAFDAETEETYVTCPEPRPSDPTKPNMTELFICSDAPVDGNAESCVPGNPPTQWPNARSCIGEECRCPGPGCAQDPLGTNYRSYYRRYLGSYERDAVELDGGNDRTTNQAPVACYGFYDEFDPKTRQTRTDDRRCVINIDVSDYIDSQKGTGEYAPENPVDRDPSDPANQRNGGAYDENTDAWHMKLSGAFSLLNEVVFERDFDGDLTNVFLNVDRLDSASLRATEQVSEERPLAASDSIRAFDDTGEERIVVSWWQKQQNEMALLMHPPVIRLLLPSGRSLGADVSDPFFQNVAIATDDDMNGRNERIELQIDGDEDILGSAIAHLERSLVLDVREEPVPVLLPLGSPVEYRARAEQWCMWYANKFGQSDCASAPQDLKNFIARLEEYADDIDDARALRGELARYAGKVLELQSAIVRPIGDWLEENIDEYRRVLDEQRTVRERFAPQWRQTVETFDRFAGDVNMPWCMNQRYTSPVYSLLDEWLPSRMLEGGRISADLLPNIKNPARQDITIDFSTISTVSGTILLPVLKPVQIGIADIPSPPDGQTYELPALPDIPSIDRIRDLIRAAGDDLPRPPANVPLPPPVNMRPLGDEALASIAQDIAAIQEIVNGMSDRYDKFWKSIGPFKPNEPDGGPNGIKRMKELLECFAWDDATCQHVETDLIERFVRIGSRPLALLIEDDDAAAPTKGFGGACVPENHVCTPARPEGATPRTRWEIIGPLTQPAFIDDLRRGVRRETLPRAAGGLSRDAFPRYEAPASSLLPAHDVPAPIDLRPPSSASSSSAS